MVDTPSISVNKLAEYIVSRGARQRQILKDRKYPDEEFNLGMYHREAAEAVAQYISGGAIDPSPISARLAQLAQATPEKVGTARRLNANIDALERFLEMLDDIDLMGASPSLGSNNAPRLPFHNVQAVFDPKFSSRVTVRRERNALARSSFTSRKQDRWARKPQAMSPQ